MRREFLEEFAAAKWKSAEEMQAFLRNVGTITAEDVPALLDVLTGKKAAPGTAPQVNRIRIFSGLADPLADRSLFEQYLRGLKAEDKDLRAALAALLLKVESPPLRPRIAELLKSADSGLRKVAVQILRKTGDPTVLRYVVEMFRERNFAGRAEAVDLAGTMPGPFSLELLKTVNESGKPAEKVKALRYLVSPEYLKGNHRAVASAIDPALQDQDETVLVEAIPAYARLCTEQDFFDKGGGLYLHHDNLRLVRAAVEGLRNFTSDRTIAALERKLFTGPNIIRFAVLQSVEHVQSPNISKVILKALEHKNGTVRERASELLTRLTRDGRIKVEYAILWLLRSADRNVQRMAVTLAASMPEITETVWGEVLGLLRGEDWWVRQQLVRPLVEAAGSGLVPHITAHLKDPSDTFRRFLLDVVSELKDPALAAPVLQAAQHDENWWVREKAIEALAGLNAAQVIPVMLQMAAAEPHFRVVVIEALRTMGAKEHAPKLAEFLAVDNPDVRLAALGCIEAFDDRSFATKVISCVNDPEMAVRQKAREIAQKWELTAALGEAAGNQQGVSMIDRLLLAVKNADGDDLILLPGNTPYIKRHGRTIPLIRNVLSHQQMLSILMPVLNAKQKQDLQNLLDVDFSYEVKSEGLRFRANIFTSRTGLSAVFRIIKGDIFDLESLGLPAVVKTFGSFKNGLVLVGGPTGSGKSTTLSTIIADINRTSRRHVISIEDPIEAVHRSHTGLINQREVGVHTPSFNHALRMTLREDPDVILVGEMRDLPTIQFAVTAAETGHLVFGTVHTVSADSSVDRLINAYPAESQEQVRAMLADSLRAVLCQYLIRHKDGQKRVLAAEIMLNNNAISNLIRKGKTFQLPSVIMTSKEQHMQMMDVSLMELYKQGKISAEEAYLKARNKADFEEIVETEKDREARRSL